MLTTKSKFSEFVKMFTNGGACADAKTYVDSILKEDETLEETIAKYEKAENKNDEFVAWFINKYGHEIEATLRLRYVKTITDIKILYNIFNNFKYLTVEESLYISSILKDEARVQEIVDKAIEPIEAASLYINYPYLTTAQEVSLKNKFERKLPTIENELATNVIVTAKAIEDSKVIP